MKWWKSYHQPEGLGSFYHFRRFPWLITSFFLYPGVPWESFGLTEIQPFFLCQWHSCRWKICALVFRPSSSQFLTFKTSGRHQHGCCLSFLLWRSDFLWCQTKPSKEGAMKKVVQLAFLKNQKKHTSLRLVSKGLPSNLLTRTSTSIATSIAPAIEVPPVTKAAAVVISVATCHFSASFFLDPGKNVWFSPYFSG